VLIAVISVW